MTEMHTPDDPAELTAEQATAAKPVKGMPYVLGISIAAIVVLFIVVLAVFM